MPHELGTVCFDSSLISRCAEAMFRRHNDPQMCRLEWSELPPKAKEGYYMDALTCLETAALSHD